MGKSLTGKTLPKGFSQRKNGLYNARKVVNGVKIDLYDRDLKTLKERFKEEEAKAILGKAAVRKTLILDYWLRMNGFQHIRLYTLRLRLIRRIISQGMTQHLVNT